MICDHGRFSLSLFVIMLSVVLVVLSSIDFHTCAIWNTSPRVNAELRYVVTLLGILAAFIYIQQIRSVPVETATISIPMCLAPLPQNTLNISKHVIR